MRATMRRRTPNFFRRLALSASLTSIATPDGGVMDVSKRLNVLAVCAVFVFLGAILLGAF
jgi:hypothetical protein